MNEAQLALRKLLENIGIIYNESEDRYELPENSKLIIYKKEGHNKGNLDDINNISSKAAER